MDDIKNRMDAMFSFASQVSYQEGHLLPIIQCSKSLIGLSIDDPPKNLLKWLESYLEKFNTNYLYTPTDSLKEMPEIISIFHLFELIESNKMEDSIEFLHKLLQVSDPRYLMELIFEISFQFSIYKILFCWFALKSVHIMDPKESVGMLFISLDCIFSNNKEEYDPDLYQLYFLLHSYHMKSTGMIRSKKIIPLIEKQIQSFRKPIVVKNLIPTTILHRVLEGGLKGLRQHLLNLAIDDISCEEILMLDALRSFCKNESASESDQIFNLKESNIC